MLRTLTLAATLAFAGALQAAPFSFVLIGDMPYGKPEEVNPLFENLIEQINAMNTDLVIHIGDTKSGSTLCDNAMLDQQLAYLDSFSAPLLYTPGDNEWTDCHRANNGGFVPTERLAYIRDTYFADPSRSFGQAPIAVQSQAAEGYPENARVMLNDVLFVTAHVVGSNNNFEARDPAAVAEFFARDAANVAWLNESFALAEGAAAVVVAIQADMFEIGMTPWNPEGFAGASGFARFAETLIARANDFGKPVLLVYGDSHVFRVTRPFPKRAPTIMALETFGSHDMHGVHVTVDPQASYPFGMRPIINTARPIVAAQN